MKNVKIHPTAQVATDCIGSYTNIWQFAVILKHAKIGSNCNINSHTFIENDVELGNNVTIKCGVYLWDGLRVGDNVFIGPNATFTNDKYPRSKIRPKSFEKTVLKKGCSIGANATINPGITIGENAMIGSGSVVLNNVPDNVTIVGNPGTIIK